MIENTQSTVNVDEVKLAAQTAERNRVLEINKIANTGKLDATFAAEHVGLGTSVEEFRRLAFEKLAGRSEQNPTQTHHAEITRDKRDTLRACASEAVLHAMDSKSTIDAQNEFKGMKLSRMCEEILFESTGKRVRRAAELVELSMQSTADFPLILADSARKMLLARYLLATPTYRKWAKGTTTSDFKTMSRLRLGEAPAFLTVAEGAQITQSTLTESREQYALKTGGRGVAFTRQMLINDDLGAFKDIVTALADQAARWENTTAYGILTANAAMSDSVALFHNTHANLGSGAIGNTALDAMYTAMGTQKGLDGSTILSELTPKYLVVPRAKKSTADQAMMESGNMVKPTDRNLFAGQLEVVTDGILDTSSTTVWYGIADPDVTPGVEYAHLEGAEGPQIIREENSNAVLGIQFLSYLDFAAKAVDWRPVYKSTGV